MERKDFIRIGLLAGVTFDKLEDKAKSVIVNKRKDLKPFYIPPNPEPLISHEGTLIRLKVRSKQTDNQFGCAEFSLAPKTMGPPPHAHKDFDEIMFVHEGVVTVMVGDEVVEVKAGGYHMRPHGIVHCFWNSTDQPAHFTDYFLNQNFDDFMEELYFKIIPELKAKGLTIHSPEGQKLRADLEKQFNLTVFPEKRKDIIEKYGLKA